MHVVLDQQAVGGFVGDGLSYPTVQGLLHVRRVHIGGGRR